MRELTIDELTHVYGAGSPSCGSRDHKKHGSKSKSKSKHASRSKKHSKSKSKRHGYA